MAIFEFVRISKKARDRISQHVKEGITEEYVKNRVLLASNTDREYLPDRSYRLVYRYKRGESFLRVQIFVRERVHNRLIREFVVYGVHVERA